MGALIYLLPLLLLAWLFWTQRRRQQQMRQAQSQITPGAQVSTTSGLLGTLISMDDDVATIEAAPGVHLRFARRAVVPASQVTGTATDAAAPATGVEQSSVDLNKNDTTGSTATSADTTAEAQQDSPQYGINPEKKAD